ncbi:hypothetical protein [Streptomyces sp. NBC_00996]|nr:hypothetical protein OG390_42155 [Streptomyces sp. NBC_00996]
MPGTSSGRTGRKPKYIQYEDFRPARRRVQLAPLSVERKIPRTPPIFALV